jgi:hypothetical protein
MSNRDLSGSTCNRVCDRFLVLFVKLSQTELCCLESDDNGGGAYWNRDLNLKRTLVGAFVSVRFLS